MKRTPMILGACLAACIAGAVSGSAIDTDPINRASDTLDMIPRHQLVFDPQSGNDRMVQNPSHYAIDTPEGRFEVGELAMRGRYAHRRELAERYMRDVEPDPAIAAMEREEITALLAPTHEVRQIEATPVAATELISKPLSPVGAAVMTLPVVPQTAQAVHGQPRTIDVAQDFAGDS